MNDKVFLDTNVFVYEIDSRASKVKRQIAHELVLNALKHHRGVVSYQVIQEFLNVVTGKFSSSISASDSQQYMKAVFEPLTVVQSSIALIR